MGLSRRAYAAHRKAKGLIGATESAVRKALSTGRIVADADGTIDPVKADWQWELATDAGQRRGAESHAAGVDSARATADLGEVRPVPVAAVESVHTAASAAADELGGGLTFTKARTAEMALKVQRNKILLQRLKGELVDRRAATQHVFDLARKERDHWLQLPARVAAELAAELECDAHAMEMALDRVIRHHLSLLAEVKVEISPDL